MRNWKEISKVSSEAHPGGTVLLESPHLPMDLFPEETARFYHEDMRLEVGGRDVSPKDIRRFLWENRGTRPVQRDRAFIETAYDEEKDVSVLRLGTLTSTSVVERMPHGN